MKIWNCPYSGEQYTGNCPVKNCPANISHIPDRPSGCFHNFLHNKSEITKFEIAYAFKTGNKRVEEAINEGTEKIKELTVFRLMVEKARSLKPQRHCSKCGIIRSTSGDCMNTIKCGERARLMRRMLGRYPFNIPDLHMTAKDIFLLLHYRRRFIRFVRAFNEAYTLRKVFGIKKALANRLYNLPTSV